MNCSYHLCSNELEGKQTKFCSRNCKNKFNIQLRRRAAKQRAVGYLGGKCACGYSKCLDALQFHHQGDKETEVSRMIANNRPWEVILPELKKCVLKCANCHAEHHSMETCSER